MITHPISLYAADAQIVKSYVEDGRCIPIQSTIRQESDLK